MYGSGRPIGGGNLYGSGRPMAGNMYGSNRSATMQVRIRMFGLFLSRRNRFCGRAKAHHISTKLE